MHRFVETSWTYRSGVVGVIAQVLDPMADRGVSFFLPFTGNARLGATAPLPTQLDLGDSPQPCSDAQRSGSARVHAPYMAGTRHPVVVRTPSGSHTLLTGRAILHGTPTQPCVAAWHARNLGRHTHRVAVITGDLSRAWLLRSTTAGSFDHHPMSCRLAPGATIDPAIWSEPGTLRIDR
jgi:hypothetical protein